MEKERCITSTHSPRRATKAATVNALSLKKKKNVCEDKAEQLQGSITRGRSMKRRKEKGSDDSSGVRQTCRRVKLKKCEDFVYGNTKVAAYKQKRNSASITNKHTLKSLNKEKYKPVDAVNQGDEHITKGHHESSRGKKVQTDVKKGVTRSKDVSLISEKNESFVVNSEVCARKSTKRKLTDVDESEESANEIAVIKGYRNKGRNNLKNSDKGKIAKYNENRLKNESMVKRDPVTENKEMLYSRNSNKTKINKQKNGTTMANKVKGNTSEKSWNKCESHTSPYGVGTLRVDELDKDKEKHEIAINVEDIGRKRTIGEVKEQDDVQKVVIVTSEVDARSETRTRSARKVKKKVDEDFDYYESEKFNRKTLVDSKKKQIHKKKDLVKEKNAENVGNAENLSKLEYLGPDPENVKDTADTGICDEAQCTIITDIKCFVCNLSFSERETYVKHIKKLHKTLIPCEYCDVSFQTKAEMWEHLKESHNDVDIKDGKYKSSVFRCTFENCSMEFSREKNRQRHINSVHLKIHYQCKFCGVRYKQIDSLKNHLKVKHDTELTDIQLDKCVIDRKTPYKCPYEECSKQFNHISNFKKHIDAVHLNLRNFQCEFCEQRLKTSSSLKFHIAARHTKDDDKKLYKCDVCSKTFLRKGSLQLHETLHTNAKNYSCSFDGCGKLFRLKSNLTKHQKIHNDVKPHQCEVCEERFSRKTYLETHMYKHTGVKDYSCDICQKSFSQKGNLMTHKLLHNRERTIYKCPICSQAFNFKSNMKKHLQRHSTHAVMNRIFNKSFEETESEGRASKCTGSSPSQTCSNDTETVSETVKMKANVSTEHKGNFGAFNTNKIWVTPNVLSTLQNGAKAVVLVMNPFKNSLDDKVQKKDVESVNIVTEENIVDKVTMESDKGGSNYCSVLKPPQQRSVACSTGQKSNEIQVDLVNDKSDRLQAEQETVAISDNLPGFSTTEEHGNDIKSAGHDTSNPVYVCIEDVTHQLSMASKAENEMSNFPKSGVKRPVLAEKNPTFTIEFDSNGMPVARLKEMEQLSGSNSSCEVLNSQQTASEMAEHIVNDIVEVTGETDESVETAGELVAINDSILNVSAENPGIEIERGHVSNLPPTETETVSKTIDKRDCGDLHEISCQNLNTDFQEDIDIDTPTVTSSYNQNNHSLLNHHTHYSAVGNMSVPFSASDIPKQVNLRYCISNPQSAESEIFNNGNALGDVLSNTEGRNKLHTSDNSDFAVKTDSVVTGVNHLIFTKKTDDETPVENF